MYVPTRFTASESAGVVPVVPAPWAPKQQKTALFETKSCAAVGGGGHPRPRVASGLVVSDQTGKSTERLMIFGY